jgi:hypothetical protein
MSKRKCKNCSSKKNKIENLKKELEEIATDFLVYQRRSPTIKSKINIYKNEIEDCFCKKQKTEEKNGNTNR